MTWDNSAITIATFLPAVGAIVIALVPKSRERMIRGLGILFTGAALVVGIAMLFSFNFGTGSGAMQFSLDTSWIPAINARYHVGMDGISLPLFELTLLLTFLCAIYSWRVVPSPGKTKGFLALVLLLETGWPGRSCPSTSCCSSSSGS